MPYSIKTGLAAVFAIMLFALPVVIATPLPVASTESADSVPNKDWKRTCRIGCDKVEGVEAVEDN